MHSAGVLFILYMPSCKSNLIFPTSHHQYCPARTFQGLGSWNLILMASPTTSILAREKLRRKLNSRQSIHRSSKRAVTTEIPHEMYTYAQAHKHQFVLCHTATLPKSTQHRNKLNELVEKQWSRVARMDPRPPPSSQNKISEWPSTAKRFDIHALDTRIMIQLGVIEAHSRTRMGAKTCLGRGRGRGVLVGIFIPGF